MDGANIMGSDLADRVVAILAAQALRAPEELTPEMRLEDLGIDSLGLAEILFAIEETFDVAVPFNANQPEAGSIDLSSVGSVCQAVEALVAQGRG